MTRVLAAVLLALAACQPAPVGAEYVEIQPNSASICAGQCAQIGMSLDSVVIMASNVGCVCRAAAPAPSGAPGAAASTGGMATIMLAEEAKRRRNNSSSTPSSSKPAYRPKY